MQDFCEVYVPEAGGEAVGVGEVDVVQEVAEGADGVRDRTLLDVHVEGVGHDAAVGETRLAPEPGALLQTVEQVRAVAVPALEREIHPQGCGVLARCPYSLNGPQPLVAGFGDG